jgi:hypothetical protein
VPLYRAAQQVQAGGEDKRDAERYRWLREACWLDDAIMTQAGVNEHEPETLDAAIDAALSREQPQGDSNG